MAVVCMFDWKNTNDIAIKNTDIIYSHSDNKEIITSPSDIGETCCPMYTYKLYISENKFTCCCNGQIGGHVQITWTFLYLFT